MNLDLTTIIRRLTTEPGVNSHTLAAELGVSQSCLQRRAVKAMTPEQHRQWVHKAKSEAAKLSQTRYAIGAVVIREGHKWIKVSDRTMRGGSNWRHLARWRYETVNGPIPKDKLLWYRDGNPLNDRLENMEVITYAQKIRRVCSRPEVEQVRKERARVAKRLSADVKRAAREIRAARIRELSAVA